PLAAPQDAGYVSLSSGKVPQLEGGDVWYVTVGTADGGKRKVKKFTTAQVIDQLKAKHLDAGQQASRLPGNGYRSLAAIKEFKQACRPAAADVGKKQPRPKALQMEPGGDARPPAAGRRRRWVVAGLGLVLLTGAGVVFYLYGPALF